MKQERKQYPVPAMLGLILTAGGACWASVWVCLHALHFPAARWTLQVSLTMVLVGVAELMVLAGISVFRSARYSQRVEIPLVLNRVVWQEEEVTGKEGQSDLTSEYTGCRMMGEVLRPSVAGPNFAGTADTGACGVLLHGRAGFARSRKSALAGYCFCESEKSPRLCSGSRCLSGLFCYIAKKGKILCRKSVRHGIFFFAPFPESFQEKLPKTQG